ncbi:permease [Evansella cellulosilytica]|uniref:Permease n=1 Tax=Evansella cellulosilytica (strain ATCC 21833 / DSM 2522 / FERM P-1141 / JCM 9156 / N-4) TaxID=649639 RepID=E6TYI9_EVAC2|nr:permease [Evansella cellulosilytica]ADU30039.1 permease [Evansella cellulosilytica DSM 2522]
MKTTKNIIGKDLLGFALLLLFLLLFIISDQLNDNVQLNSISSNWINVNTIFLSIVLEAIPFILLGVFVSSLIQVFVSEDRLQRFLPKNAIVALFPAAVLGAVLPLCECAIVPVVRRLIKKGMPLHVGVVFLVAAPILNPIVFASTYYAFRGPFYDTNTILFSRMGLAFVLSIIIGGILYAIFKNNSKQLRTDITQHQLGHVHTHDHHHSEKPSLMKRLKETLYHAVDEFFMMGKYLILGAFIASLFQTFLDRSLLESIGQNDYSSTIVMMAFAYLLSLCSEADAFVASTFAGQFTNMSIVGFLVYGPMLDLKNTFMLFAFFKARFVITFMITVTFVVFTAIIVLFGFIL